MMRAPVCAVVAAALTHPAPQSILSPIGSLTLLWHVLMSPVLLREPLLLLDAVACSVVVAGVCVTAVFGNQGGVEYTIASIAWLYSHASCTAFLVATGIVMLASAVGAAIASGKTRRFALVAIPGIAAGTAMVFTKATVEIMSNHAAERWVDPIALFNIAAMLLATAVQVIGLVVAAKHCDAMFVVPVFLAVYTVQATMAAFFCFREFASMQTLDVVMFVVGVGIVTAGCWLFTQRRSTDGVHEGAEDDGEVRSRVLHPCECVRACECPSADHTRVHRASCTP